LVVRAYVKAATGRKDAALADAREAASRANIHFGIPRGFHRSPALALRAAGAPDEALAYAHKEVDLARRVAWPSVQGQAALVLGLVSPPEHALDHFAEAARKLDGSTKRLDFAHALVEYGAALRRANRRSDAREPLEHGMELADRCTARPLAERARTELRACGARPRRFVVTGADSLTAVERRVARMAADGLSNTEIAQALFVTRKTIESHLGHVYRKLSITSRTELARALEEGQR
jgi:DNA-binding CsgD family transcriptional regulator